MLIKRIQKEPGELRGIGINYQPAILDGDYISTASVSASLEDNPLSDQTSTVLQGGAVLIEGTATEAGSTAHLHDSAAQFAIAGVRPGHKFLNLTQKWVATVKTIVETAGGWQRITFEEKPRAVASGDTYKFFIVKTIVKAGVSGQNYRVRFLVTTNLGRIFEDEIMVEVRDL